MAIKIYSKEFVRMLPEIYAVKAHFLNTFGGELQIADGVAESETFMELKTIDADVTVNEYSTDGNVGFGSGTGNTNRFGQRKEVKAVNSQVPYEATLAIHEGIDRVTVNDNMDQVIVERLAKHAEAWTKRLNGILSKELSTKAAKTLTGTLDEAGVTKAFAEAHAEFVNNEINEALTQRAYVSPAVYNLVVDSKLATTGKNSSVNIDENSILKFKGFVVEELAESNFQSGENIIFAVDNVGVVGVGLQTARTFESEDFDGVALQAAAKLAKYLPTKNQKGVLKAKLTAVGA